jgi:acetyl/propionyl-CoA carboxylase alpha subunit/acetyl-CoA carboxylase carboxyltransferase component
MQQIRRLAIVNRGEPAMRALTAVAELNAAGDRPQITAVVVHTDPDVRAWYVREAAEALCLGPATYVDPADGHRKSSYLDEERVVEVLRGARVDAVWPGWGFLAESASFAERCEKAGIVFVGPGSATIRLLGDKVAAKRLAERAGVPVVPWSDGPVDDATQAMAIAERLGYPVVIKAAAGGGGRGIRMVGDPADLATAFESASAEANLAFGDATLFIERLVPAARHVEVQVVADGQGAVWTLGVRDCSIQRRHQKVIEESASTVLDAAAEQKIRRAAVDLTTTAGYRNAGTVEFLVTPDGASFMFMEVNTRLQVEHPVTEMTTGADLVKLQLHIAAGGRLDGSPPPVSGHAIEARLCAEDPGRGFEPAPGRIAKLVLPTGTGIRVDTGVREGDAVSPEFDSMIAKIIAWGGDRREALARLRRALAQTTAVVAGGTTNRSFLLTLLDRPEVRDGNVDNQWLDTLSAAGGHLPAADPVAVLQAAVEAYDRDQAAQQAAFHARAVRGHPTPVAAVGHACQLRYRGATYRLHVYRTGPSTYRVADSDTLMDVTVDRVSAYERRVVVNGQWHNVVAVTAGPVIRLEIGGSAHRISRDDGGAVRSEWPAVVVRVPVAAGDTVAEGDPLVVLESMKMEAVIAAPFSGEVTAVEVAANQQVEAGALLLRITASGQDNAPADGTASVDLTSLAARPESSASPTELAYSALLSYLLGYDLDPASVRGVLGRQHRLGKIEAPADPDLLRWEDRLLDAFADIAALYRRKIEPDQDGQPLVGGPRQYMLSYLQWLDPDAARLPSPYRETLARALRRYDVHSLDRTPELEAAVVWLFRSFRRIEELAPAVASILERRIRHSKALSKLAVPELRERMERLAAATQGRYQDVADLARTVRFHYLDEPMLRTATSKDYAQMERHLDALRANPDGPGRQRRIAALLSSRLALQAMVLRHRLGTRRAAPTDAFCEVLLEVITRRFYQIRDLRDLTLSRHEGHLLCSADYEVDDRPIHLVVAHLPLAEMPGLDTAVARHLANVEPGRHVVVDAHTWRDGETPSDADTAAQITDLVRDCEFGRRLWRLDITVTSVTSRSRRMPHGSQSMTFRQRRDGRFFEELIYRNLHPMMAKRLDLWRLANFRLQRLPSAADVHVFHGVAHDNPEDHRLFALAEVRDLVPVQDAAGAVSYPRLELVGLSAISAMRHALTAIPAGDPPIASRIVLYVRPPWDIPPEKWPDVARSFGPLAIAAGLQKVVLCVRIPEPGGTLRDAVLHIDGVGRQGVVVRELPLSQEPIKPVSPYRLKVLRAQRFGAPYPYEIIRMLAPPPGSVTHFPAGHFAEYDLDEADQLVPVGRDHGRNTANVVVGLLTNYTAKVPEGMTRVIMLSDPTRGLGNLAEPECRRIMAALGLARRMGLPVEWFALSSGARVAMDSGTENMDWTAAVLRGLIEFTQAGGEVNIIVTGINVGAQSYWNAEATMLMHTRGILVMTPGSVMVLTGKQALDYSGGVSAEDNIGIGGFDRIMGPNGQAQYWAHTLEEACHILLRHYDHTFVVPGERHPRRATTEDPADRDIRRSPHPQGASDFTIVGDVFSSQHNPERKKPFDIRAVLRAVTDTDARPLERWAYWREADNAVVWDAHIGGIPVCLLGLESQTIPRGGYIPADGPTPWTSGTLFPQSARKLARAVNAASRNRPLVVLANLSGFDGSPESMRHWQLEYGAEIGRAITNFHGPIVFVVITRYHGGAFVVFSKRLNEHMETAAIEGSFASVIGGAPAAATVFGREVRTRIEADPRIIKLRARLNAADGRQAAVIRARLIEMSATVRSQKLGEVASEFDQTHTIGRALAVGSVDRIIPAGELRPYLIDAIGRGLARELVTPDSDRKASGNGRLDVRLGL